MTTMTQLMHVSADTDAEQIHAVLARDGAPIVDDLADAAGSTSTCRCHASSSRRSTTTWSSRWATTSARTLGYVDDGRSHSDAPRGATGPMSFGAAPR